MRPFLGGGVDFITAKIKGTYQGQSAEDKDTGTGFWISGGIYWTLGKSFNLGFELGFSQATVTLFNVDGEGGGGHAGFLQCGC